MMPHSLAYSEIDNRDDNIVRCTDLAISSIYDSLEGSCTFDAGQTCVAIHQFRAVIENAVGDISYNWNVDVGAVQGSEIAETLEVWVTSDVDVYITVTLEITDDLMTTTHTKVFNSIHTENA